VIRYNREDLLYSSSFVAQNGTIFLFVINVNLSFKRDRYNRV
jgi:hypothetical protein